MSRAALIGMASRLELHGIRISASSRVKRGVCVFLGLSAIVAAGASAGRTHPGSVRIPIAETPSFLAQPLSASIAADKGKFRIMAGGEQVGKEEFEISQSGANWIARGTSDVKTADGAVQVTGTLELRADGTPLHYEWSTQGPKEASASIVFSGSTATIDLRVKGARSFTQQFTFTSPQIVILDNNLYHQYAVLADLYDWNKKGVQNFSVLVPQEMTPGTVTVEWLGQQNVEGKKLDELRVKTEDLELDLYLEGQRLVRIDAPNANAEIVRE